jgi:hypothetical protein
VTVVPEVSRISVLRRGRANGSITSSPLGGHCAATAAAPSAARSTWPSTKLIAVGNRAKSKNAQNQPTKNITSDAMNRIMP